MFEKIFPLLLRLNLRRPEGLLSCPMCRGVSLQLPKRLGSASQSRWFVVLCLVFCDIFLSRQLHQQIVGSEKRWYPSSSKHPLSASTEKGVWGCHKKGAWARTERHGTIEGCMSACPRPSLARRCGDPTPRHIDMAVGLRRRDPRVFVAHPTVGRSVPAVGQATVSNGGLPPTMVAVASAASEDEGGVLSHCI